MRFPGSGCTQRKNISQNVASCNVSDLLVKRYKVPAKEKVGIISEVEYPEMNNVKSKMKTEK